MHNQPNPNEVLQGIAVMQAITLGFLIGSQIVLNRRLRRIKVDSVIVNTFATPVLTESVA